MKEVIIYRYRINVFFRFEVAFVFVAYPLLDSLYYESALGRNCPTEGAMKKALMIIITAGLLVFALTFVLSTGQNKPIQPSQEDKLESFLKANNASEEIAQAYRFALKDPDNVLSKVKCYCGCLKQGHRNNRDCFINDDGSFDLMGLNCGLCVKTALISQEMLDQGKSVAEIALYVDNRWGNN